MYGVFFRRLMVPEPIRLIVGGFPVTTFTNLVTGIAPFPEASTALYTTIYDPRVLISTVLFTVTLQVTS